MKCLLQAATVMAMVPAAILPAAAQDETAEIVSAIAGEWLLAPEDGRPGCRVTLGAGAAIGGREIGLAPDCAATIPAIAEAAAWRFGEEGLVIANAERKTILTLVEDESAAYSSLGEPGDRLLMLKAGPGIDRVPNACEAFGAWSLVSGSKTLCVLELKDGPPPGGEESFGLTLGKGCAPSIEALKLASWRIEGMALKLYGTDGDAVSLEPDGKGGFSETDGAARRLVRK